jgi:acetyl esterase/lipase
MPPTIVVSGEKDVVTPDADARKFCDRIVTFGDRCEFLHYDGVGHLLTRKIDPQAQFRGNFDFDPAATADAEARVWTFLRRLGYIRP